MWRTTRSGARAPTLVGMARTPLTLAALATAAVPGLDVVKAERLGTAGGDADVAVLSADLGAALEEGDCDAAHRRSDRVLLTVVSLQLLGCEPVEERVGWDQGMSQRPGCLLIAHSS